MRLFNYYPSNPRKLDHELEKKIFYHSLILPAAFVVVLWIVEIVEQVGGFSFVPFGVYPHHLKGLPGILFSPFIHSDFGHLISNSVPFFIQLYLLAGICVWIAGREAWHIGASGVVYALAAFHFVSGIIRNDVRLLTVSEVVVFLYGGLIWGMMPIDPEISWEGHLWGAVSGVVLALYYRKYQLRRERFDWEDEEDEEVDGDQLRSQSQSSEVNNGNNRKPGNVSHTGEF